MTSREALERCVGLETDVRAGRADLNKEPISRADDYGELAEEKFDQVVGLAEDCEEAAVASAEAASCAIETSQRQVVQLPPIGGGSDSGSAAAAKPKPKPKPKPKSMSKPKPKPKPMSKSKPKPKPRPPAKAPAVRILQPLQTSPTGMAAALAATHLQSEINLPKRSVPHGSSNQEDSDKDLAPRPSTIIGREEKGGRQQPTPLTLSMITRHEQSNNTSQHQLLLTLCCGL